MPINIEVSGVDGAWAIFEHVHPPGVLVAGGHVVGHDIEEQPEAVALQPYAEGRELLFASEIGIKPGGVGGVVTMIAAVAALQKRGGVDVGDPKTLQIGEQGGRVAEREIAVELQ